MTTAPYRSRHAAPDESDEDSAPAEPTRVQAPPDVQAVPVPAAAHPAWSAYEPANGPGAAWAPPGPAGEPDAPIWVPMPPPADADPSTAPRGATPGEFIPLVRPKRTSRRTRVAAMALAVVALLGAVGWYGFKAFTATKTDTAAPVSVQVPVPTVTVRSAVGHFVAHFANHPQTATANGSLNGFTYRSVVLADVASKQAVGGFTYDPAIPQDRMSLVLHGGLNGFARSAEASVTNLVDGTYQGHLSLTATLIDKTSEPAHVLIFEQSGKQMYLLVAESDASLAELEANFTPTA